MLEAQRRDEQLLSYTLDRTEYTLDTSALRSCEPGQLWLTAFVVSGIAIGLAFELLHLHAGLGQDNCQTFLLPFCGYVGQCVVGGVWTAAAGTWRDGAWTRTMVGMMLLSSMGNGVAQALDYVALTHAGITLYTILHSSVIFFACGIAAFVLRTPVNGVQWASVLAVVVGLVLTGVPAPIAGHGSFGVGLACAIAGSLSLAASYPLAELVFRLGRAHRLPSL
jgi:drug/metabolite transporter (DMT)-like permease